MKRYACRKYKGQGASLIPLSFVGELILIGKRNVRLFLFTCMYAWRNVHTCLPWSDPGIGTKGGVGLGYWGGVERIGMMVVLIVDRNGRGG